MVGEQQLTQVSQFVYVYVAMRRCHHQVARVLKEVCHCDYSYNVCYLQYALLDISYHM